MSEQRSNKLTLLKSRQTSLELCTYCPKLCRSACPVSNAEPRETLTPWGKMSLAHFVANGSVPLDEAHVAPTYACTGCGSCRENCVHRNEVAATLLEARGEWAKHQVAPPAARRVSERFAHRERALKRASLKIAAAVDARGDGSAGILVGCAYARGAPREAEAAVRSANSLLREPVAVIDRCCGLPLALAGQQHAFVEHAERFARQTRSLSRLVVVDPGCARTLLQAYPGAGVKLTPKVELLVALAAENLQRLETQSTFSSVPVRYLDPCHLGRGLGVYEEPRQVLGRILGRAPSEMGHTRERAPCSGAGGLVPLTMPEVSRTIRDTLVAEHEEVGGGTLVTACGSSLLTLRRTLGTRVVDLVRILEAALEPWKPAP